MAELFERLDRQFGAGVIGLVAFLGIVFIAFSLTSPQFLSVANFDSIAFQLPELGLLTLAMLMPIISGGFNLAIIYTANICGLTLAWVLMQYGGVDAGLPAFILGSVAAIAVGALAGCIMGLVIAYIGAHPILVSLAMMIFLRGLGEFLTRGGDISGFPDFLKVIGHGHLAGIPVPLILFCFGSHCLACSADAYTPWIFSLYDRIKHQGRELFRYPHQTHADIDLHTLGCDVCDRRYPDADAIQFCPCWSRRGAVASDGARLLSWRR